MEPPAGPAPRTFTLSAEHELRFETPALPAPPTTLTLLSGSAEIFGAELPLNRAVALPPSASTAAFTWHGCTLALATPDAAATLAYTATDTPMPAYAKAHGLLQRRRDAARVAARPGPRVGVVGPRDAGKTALVGILGSYCVKANGSCCVVDLDVGGTGVAGGVPGGVAVSVVRNLDVEEGGMVFEKVSAGVYGHVGVKGNLGVAGKVYSGVGSIVDRLMVGGEGWAGCVVDMCGDVEGGDGLDVLLAGVESVRADVVFVLGGERLFASVRGRLAANPRVEVVLLPKSGGVVPRDEEWRQRERSRRVRDYFYGADGLLNPFSTVVEFASVTVLEVVGEAAVVPDCVLPIGATSTLDPLQPRVVALGRELLHAVIGVSQAEREEDVLSSPVHGFVHVSKVDVDRGTMTVLAPSPGRLPGKFLLVGSIKWME
jgi:polyribonucleotide 5'-hydroxyl-kinase